MIRLRSLLESVQFEGFCDMVEGPVSDLDTGIYFVVNFPDFVVNFPDFVVNGIF